jgi:dUTP pyrophosphatase
MLLKKETKLFSVPVKKLYSDAIVPTYATEGDAGADLYAYESVNILRYGFALVGTGIALAIPAGYVGLVHPRSGLAVKSGITVLNAPGTIDSGYRGEIKVNLINLGLRHKGIAKGDRIAQIVFQKYSEADFQEVTELDETVRGIGGHGSTGGIDVRI